MQPPAPPAAPAAPPPPPDAVASPVQNPLAAPRDGPEPVAYVSLVPGAAASRDGYFAVATAYSAPEDAKIRELSTLTLRLTIISLAVTLLFWLVVFAVNVAANPREAGWALFQLLVNGALYCYVAWVGVHGVRTKNAACCANADGGGCCCEHAPGYLTVFFSINVFLATLFGLYLVTSLIIQMWVGVAIYVVLFALAAATAWASSRLMSEIAASDVGRAPAIELARVPRLQQQQQPIPVVAAGPLDAPAPAPPSTREEPLKADVARGAEAV